MRDRGPPEPEALRGVDEVVAPIEDWNRIEAAVSARPNR